MAYDPKSYLEQALKTGFQQAYVPPTSPESGDGTYDAPVATFGDVQVRPLMELFGQSEQDIGTPQQTGYAVSRPLKDGYFENSIFDNEGKFLRKTISEPAESWWEGPLQLALTAAPFVGGPLATAANVYKGVQAAKSGDILGAASSLLPGAAQIPGLDPEFASSLKTAGGYAKTASGIEKAIEGKDVLALLEATSGIPGAPKVPPELTDVLKGVGQVKRGYEAIERGDPYALFKEIVGYSKSGEKSKTPSASETTGGYGGAETSGFYDPDIEAGLMYYGSDPSQEKYAEEDRLLGKYPAPVTQPEPKTAMDPMELNRFLEANIDDPGTIETLMQEYYPDLYRQTIGVTGTKAAPDATYKPPSIRDIGTVTKIAPGEKLEGTEIKEPDLAAGLKPAVTGGTKTATKPAAPAAQDDWLRRLAFLLGANRPEDEEEQPYQLANVPKYEDLAYGFSGETPYMRG